MNAYLQWQKNLKDAYQYAKFSCIKIMGSSWLDFFFPNFWQYSYLWLFFFFKKEPSPSLPQYQLGSIFPPTFSKFSLNKTWIYKIF